MTTRMKSEEDLSKLLDCNDFEFGYLLHEEEQPLYCPSQGSDSWMVFSPIRKDLTNIAGLPPQANQAGTSRGVIQDPNERKRMSDRAYRERVKDGKKNMQNRLDNLYDENKQLKYVNHSLRDEIGSMNQKLLSTAGETGKLYNEICRLKREGGCQQVLVEAFLNKLVGAKDKESQVRTLRHEIAQLRQNVVLIAPMEDKRDLCNTIIELRHENKKLKLQVEALCHKISNERQPQHNSPM